MNGQDANPPESIGCWKIGKCLGRGAFSGVYEGTLKTSAGVREVIRPHDTDTEWVLKMSVVPDFPNPGGKKRRKTKKQKEAEAGSKLLYWEYTIYSNFLRDIPCVPRRPKGRCLYGESSKENNVNGSPTWRYLALERLGSTLRELVTQCEGQKAPPKTVFNIAAQVIEGLEQVHKKGIIFRDIKPENFMVGPSDNGRENRVYLVDFGASCKYILHDGKHMSTGAGPAGTPLYMSIFSHENAPPSRRDDLISLGYMLLWMLNGVEEGLPWEKETNENAVIKMKKSISTKTLCSGLETEYRKLIQNYLDEVLSLDFQEEPDYASLRAPFLKYYGDSLCWSTGTRSSKAAKQTKKTAKKTANPTNTKGRKRKEPKVSRSRSKKTSTVIEISDDEENDASPSEIVNISPSNSQTKTKSKPCPKKQKMSPEKEEVPKLRRSSRLKTKQKPSLIKKAATGAVSGFVLAALSVGAAYMLQDENNLF